MSGADFLVELGTEELPPKALLKLQNAFATELTALIDSAGLGHGEVLAYATPRRLAILVKNLATEQPAQVIENRGPPLRLAYDEKGSPTRAAEAFANKCGVTVSELQQIETAKGAWLYYKGTAPGAPAAALLPEFVDTALNRLPIPKRMRWGDRDIEFVRPVHWLVMLHGADVVPAEILGLQAGRVTFGHRFHAPGPIELQEPGEYAERLRSNGRVVASFAERRERVVAAANEAAAELGGQAILEDEVVDEVTALVEWPVPVAGQFADEFLRLPREVLIATLQDHQRYFPVGTNDTLQAAFITISNLDSRNPAEVRRGNERVVLPRLADAAFFWDQDTKQPLAERVPLLSQVVYQQGLGSLADKTARVAELARRLTAKTGADAAHVERAAELSRADLLTEMVGEFPELQGRMGYYYALNDGENKQVAVALEEQYLPRHAGDRLPETAVGQTLALADRLDTLAGIFSLGKKPSGNKDPFGLRRQALGLLRILIEGSIDLDIKRALLSAAELQPHDGGATESAGFAETAKPAAPADPHTVAESLYAFIIDRLRAWYLDGLAPGLPKGAVTAEMFAGVAARAPSSLADFHARLQAVRNFTAHDGAASLAAANKRIANILRKAESATDNGPGFGAATVDPQLFEAEAEKQLHNAIEQLRGDHVRDLNERNYESLLVRLAGLREPVDRYFDEVMVMTDDPALQANRLAQLAALRKLFLDVADISQITAT